jgi:hypothetical protein
MSKPHNGLPVSGYRPQSPEAVATVNGFKADEERILRKLDELRDNTEIDGRWLAIGRTQLEQAFMAINRAVFQPGRVELPDEIEEYGASVELIAEACHEANRAYCLSIGDTSQMPWADAPEWQRESAIKGVEFIRANPGATPEQSHESWMAEKRAAGWKYGPVKDPEKLEHPAFLPYAELPQEQRSKDYIFGAIVRSFS